MNSIPFATHWHLHNVWAWYDREPELRCAIITGVGEKSFCAGQDLLELGRRRAKADAEMASGKGKGKEAGDGEEDEDKGVLDIVRASAGHPPTGFAGISRRVGKKPIIAAVNGFALGGGFEIVLNWYSFPSPFFMWNYQLTKLQ
jgi:enoyl-CoA hydratase/carnithine racemase